MVALYLVLPVSPSLMWVTVASPSLSYSPESLTTEVRRRRWGGGEEGHWEGSQGWEGHWEGPSDLALEIAVVDVPAVDFM